MSWQREKVVEQTVQTAQTVVFSTERQITDLQTAQHTTEVRTQSKAGRVGSWKAWERTISLQIDTALAIQ